MLFTRFGDILYGYLSVVVQTKVQVSVCVPCLKEWQIFRETKSNRKKKWKNRKQVIWIHTTPFSECVVQHFNTTILEETPSVCRVCEFMFPSWHFVSSNKCVCPLPMFQCFDKCHTIPWVRAGGFLWRRRSSAFVRRDEVEAFFRNSLTGDSVSYHLYYITGHFF